MCLLVEAIAAVPVFCLQVSNFEGVLTANFDLAAFLVSMMSLPFGRGSRVNGRGSRVNG